ncbi:hypothetical protein O181_099321 [Austropuccinia psidii MF-1]|uniref:CCHC-type domain-containing protein n=1 Tax=Austropuccinia psidii MF-1 TaxID=1389203 RepID=A0A9Q3JD76_9BASI|nr:hypothetical protein [Austropuccinia psidii MF-1]
MKPQPQGHAMDNSYHQDDIKPDVILMKKARSPSQYHDEYNMSYSEKEALKQLPEASSCPEFSGTGEYDHMELINYIYGLFIDVPSLPDYWITARINTEFKGNADDIANIFQDLRQRTNIEKYTTYEISGFKEKQPFRVEFKDKPRERVAEVEKKKNSCHNCGSTDHYANNCPKAKKRVYAIEKVPEEESPTEDSESDSMGDAIREQSDDDQDPREEFLVESQEETPLKIQDIQLEAGMPQYTSKKNLCKHTQDAQTFLVTPAKGMAYIHGTATEMTKLSVHPLPKLGKPALADQGKELQNASGKMNSIGKIIKEIIITHRKHNIRLNPEFVVLDDAHIQGFLLGADYQRMYGIDIYNSKNRHITIGTNNEKKFSLDIYQISAQDPLEELLNEFRERQFSTTLTSKPKLSLLKMLRKNISAFSIGEEPLGKIRRNDIE